MPNLRPITILERGEVVKVVGRSFIAGDVPIVVGQRVSAHAERILRRFFDGKQVEFEMEVPCLT